jgi:hypothetical protein
MTARTKAAVPAPEDELHGVDPEGSGVPALASRKARNGEQYGSWNRLGGSVRMTCPDDLWDGGRAVPPVDDEPVDPRRHRHHHRGGRRPVDAGPAIDDHQPITG